MAQSFKCTICQETASHQGREGAAAGGWTLIDVLTKDRRKYWCICPRHTGTSWIRQALGEPAEKKRETE